MKLDEITRLDKAKADLIEMLQTYNIDTFLFVGLIDTGNDKTQQMVTSSFGKTITNLGLIEIIKSTIISSHTKESG